MTGISLATWASIAEIIGAGSIVTGLIVGWVQIRHLRRQQREVIATNLAQTFYNPELSRAVSLILPLRDGVTLAEVRELGEEHQAAATMICTSFETMGLLVYRRIAPMDLVLDLAGGIVGTMSIKLRRWNEDIRAEQNQPSFAEWFEWLGDRALEQKGQSAAHLDHKDWKGGR